MAVPLLLEAVGTVLAAVFRHVVSRLRGKRPAGEDDASSHGGRAPLGKRWKVPDTFANLRTGGRQGRAYDWEGLHNSSGLQGLIDLLNAGCYVGLSSTSDGGAAGVTVMHGDSKIKEYWVDLDGEDVAAWLARVLEAVTSPPPPRDRSRRAKTEAESAP